MGIMIVFTKDETNTFVKGKRGVYLQLVILGAPLEAGL